MPVRCPPPPAAALLDGLRPSDVHTCADPVLRIYRRSGEHATTWDAFRGYGPLSTMRFDHHPRPLRQHPTRAVHYAATGHVDSGWDPLAVSVLEVFSETGVVRSSTGTHWVGIWRPIRPLRLLDLSGSDWLTRHQGTAALMSGPRGVGRRWSAAIWNAYSEIDGITWHSSALPPGRCLMLFERAREALPERPALNVPLGHPGLMPSLARICEDYGLTLL